MRTQWVISQVLGYNQLDYQCDGLFYDDLELAIRAAKALQWDTGKLTYVHRYSKRRAAEHR